MSSYDPDVVLVDDDGNPIIVQDGDSTEGKSGILLMGRDAQRVATPLQAGSDSGMMTTDRTTRLFLNRIVELLESIDERLDRIESE